MGSVFEPKGGLISGIAHINLTVPEGSLQEAEEFYGTTLGLSSTPVPKAMQGRLSWFNIGDSKQQVHIAFGKPTDFATDSSRHPCFRLSSPEALLEARKRVYEHHVRGGPGAPKAADKPGETDSGEQEPEFPSRFFARDYAGNRLEFSI